MPRLRRWLRCGVVTTTAMVACKLTHHELPTIDGSSDAVVDAGLCVGSSLECVGDTLRTCSGAGMIAVDTQCTWGCGVGKCKALVPSGNGATTMDTLGAGNLADVAFADGLRINGENGEIGSSGDANSVRSSGTGVMNGIDYKVHNSIAVFRVRSLKITGTVLLLGPYPIVLVSDGDVAVAGVLDARGSCSSRTGGPGGGSGGSDQGSDGQGSGAGLGSDNDDWGGGGGGHGGVGGAGGSNPASGGPTFGNAQIAVLAGGGGGAGGGGTSNSGSGGGGGGAIQLISNTQIVIDALGGINAGGCGGLNGSGSNDGGGGGGGGGAILLEGPIVSIAGILAVNGGGGGGGSADNNERAENGRLDRMPAAGANMIAKGGAGGAGATLAGGAGGTQSNHGGGGGGGVGWIRVNTHSGSAKVTGVLSPSFDDPSTTCTQGQATVQ